MSVGGDDSDRGERSQVPSGYELIGEEQPSFEQYIKIWDRVVQVQQHFNELCLRIRNFAVVVLGGLLTAGAFAVRDGLTVKILSFEVSAALPILLICLVAWAAFFVMDYYWYHRLLLGAVQHGAFIEEKLNRTLPELGLAARIGAASPVTIRLFGRTWVAHSNQRLKFFYGLGFLLIVGLALLLIFGAILSSNTKKSSSAIGLELSAKNPAITEKAAQGRSDGDSALQAPKTDSSMPPKPPKIRSPRQEKY